jgi:hypothetical protein
MDVRTVAHVKLATAIIDHVSVVASVLQIAPGDPDAPRKIATEAHARTTKAFASFAGFDKETMSGVMETLLICATTPGNGASHLMGVIGYCVRTDESASRMIPFIKLATAEAKRDHMFAAIAARIVVPQ